MKLAVEEYPERYRENIRIVLDRVPTDPQTAYAMILMTALMMDLDPSDREVAEMVLKDCSHAMEEKWA